MWNKRGTSIKKYSIFSLFFCFFIFASSIPVSATDIMTASMRDKRVVKVGFPIQEGLTHKNEEGEYDGYTVAYLEEVKKYTGWEYEYVEVEGNTNVQLTTLMEMLQNGEIDLLGGMLYSESLAKMYDYPSYSYGQAYTVLAVSNDNSNWLENDFTHWNGITIGTYSGFKKREENFIKYATVNGFTYELKEYENYAELIAAISIGEVEATFQADISMDENLKSIGKFSPVPYYFAVTKGNTEIIQELNRAQSRIEESTPNIQTMLYSEYFEKDNHFALSNENKEYIKSLGTIKVLFIDGKAPIHYYDGKKAQGISIKVLEEFKKKTGLSYELIIANSYEEAIELVKAGDIDLLLGVSNDAGISNELNLKFSIPYLESQKVLVFNEKEAQTVKGDTSVVYNVEEVISNINKSAGYSHYIDIYSTNFYLQKKGLYNNVVVNYNAQKTIQYSFAITENISRDLLTIIDSFISNITDEELQQFIYENTLVSADYTITEFFKVYFSEISIGVLVVAIIITLVYVRGVRREAKISSEMAFQYKQFDELTKLMNECFFYYNYEKDILEIHNNQIMFDRKNCILNYLETNHEYEFLNEMIESKIDDFHNFILNTPRGPQLYRAIVKIIKDEKGNAIFAFGRIYDVNDDITEQRELMERSQKDSLTELSNRAGGEEKIKCLLERNASYGVLLLLDLDNFKLVNDNMGHPIGDNLLKKVAHFIDKSFTSNDIKCRLGGDEFLVYINDEISSEVLYKKLEQFISEINVSIFYLYSQYNISVSIGAAFANNDTYGSLYEKADRAMYESKNNGKNQFFIYEPK